MCTIWLPHLHWVLTCSLYQYNSIGIGSQSHKPGDQFLTPRDTLVMTGKWGGLSGWWGVAGGLQRWCDSYFEANSSSPQTLRVVRDNLASYVQTTSSLLVTKGIAWRFSVQHPACLCYCQKSTASTFLVFAKCSATGWPEPEGKKRMLFQNINAFIWFKWDWITQTFGGCWAYIGIRS